MNDVEKIINRIKEGEDLTVSCSMYEEIIYYKNGKFMSSFDNGEQCATNERSEKYVRRSIMDAFQEPDYYGMYIGDEDLTGEEDCSGD